MLCLWLSMLGVDQGTRDVGRGKILLVHDIDDYSHDENDDANDNDESPGFEKVLVILMITLWMLMLGSKWMT